MQEGSRINQKCTHCLFPRVTSCSDDFVKGDQGEEKASKGEDKTGERGKDDQDGRREDQEATDIKELGYREMRPRVERARRVADQEDKDDEEDGGKKGVG